MTGILSHDTMIWSFFQMLLSHFQHLGTMFMFIFLQTSKIGRTPIRGHNKTLNIHKVDFRSK